MPNNDKTPDQETLNAVRRLITWIGDDPERPGLAQTPQRVLKAYRAYFAGYQQDPAAELMQQFDEIDDYHDAVILRDIEFYSHCEHHLAPIVGSVSIGYLPNNRVVGISKLARVVDIYARRLQIQERMTAQIAHCLHTGIKARGVAVLMQAQHHCIRHRGAKKNQSVMQTRALTGVFQDDPLARQEILRALEA